MSGLKNKGQQRTYNSAFDINRNNFRNEFVWTQAVQPSIVSAKQNYN